MCSDANTFVDFFVGFILCNRCCVEEIFCFTLFLKSSEDEEMA